MSEQDEFHSSADDEMGYEEELRASIQRGLADCAAGRLIPLEELMREFGVRSESSAPCPQEHYLDMVGLKRQRRFKSRPRYHARIDALSSPPTGAASPLRAGFGSFKDTH